MSAKTDTNLSIEFHPGSTDTRESIKINLKGKQIGIHIQKEHVPVEPRARVTACVISYGPYH